MAWARRYWLMPTLASRESRACARIPDPPDSGRRGTGVQTAFGQRQGPSSKTLMSLDEDGDEEPGAADTLPEPGAG